MFPFQFKSQVSINLSKPPGAPLVEAEENSWCLN